MYINPERGIFHMDRKLYDISTRTDGPNTLTWQSSGTDGTPIEPPPVTVKRNRKMKRGTLDWRW